MNCIYFPADELGDVPGAGLELAGHVELRREEDVQVGLQMPMLACDCPMLASEYPKLA